MPQSSSTATWTLTPAAFARLLSALDGDPARAAAAYEQLRYRLVGLLRWWGAADPEALADRTLDRVARKLEEGAEISAGSFGAYARGVARLVFYESTRDRGLVMPPGAEPAPPPDDDRERAASCLDRCLAQLSAGDRDHVLRYYGDGRTMDVRRALADELRMTPTALRVRMHRLRARLERCVTQCMGPS